MRLWMGALAACAMLWAGPAASAVMLATFYGVVTSGEYQDLGPGFTESDGTAFGLPGNIDGQAFRADLVYDTEVGWGDETYREGYFDLAPNPFRAISVTVNGVKLGLDLGYWTFVGLDPGHDFGVFPEDSFTKLQLGISTAAAPTRLDIPFAGDGDGEGYFFLHNRARGGVILSRVVVSAIPEPATWIMMIVGFGLLGATLRSRRAGTA